MNKHIVVLDFDRTIAETFVPSPNGIDVSTASRHAIDKLFGKKGLEIYDEIGGLRSREPGELIALMQSRLEFETPIIEATQQYVDAKIAMIWPEISPHWPRLLPGVREFFQDVERGRLPVDAAVLSSGHDGPIKRVFEINGLNPPENLVTSDDLRRKPMPSGRPRYKPYTFQLAQVHRNWDEYRGKKAFYSHEARTPHDKHRMVYVGDDISKDGGLSENARIPFIFIPREANGLLVDAVKGQLYLKDFCELTSLLEINRQRLLNGESFAQILFGRADSELFPPLDAEARPFNRWIEARRNGHGTVERF